MTAPNNKHWVTRGICTQHIPFWVEGKEDECWVTTVTVTGMWIFCYPLSHTTPPNVCLRAGAFLRNTTPRLMLNIWATGLRFFFFSGGQHFHFLDSGLFGQRDNTLGSPMCSQSQAVRAKQGPSRDLLIHDFVTKISRSLRKTSTLTCCSWIQGDWAGEPQTHKPSSICR